MKSVINWKRSESKKPWLIARCYPDIRVKYRSVQQLGHYTKHRNTRVTTTPS